MASKDDHSYLPELTEDIDKQLIKWLNTYEMYPLNLIAVLLARLTWIAKQSGVEKDFVELLKAPEQILEQEQYEKVVH